MAQVKFAENKDIGITIIIPLYNGIEFLEESVSSVINQTYKKWEIIIGINGHVKNSDIEKQAKEIITTLNKDDSYEIYVIYFNTKGKPQTINKMVNYARYNHIALLDVDDIWLPNKLESQVPLLDLYDVVGTSCEYFGDRTGVPFLPYGDFSYNHDFFNSNPIINSSVIIKKCDALWDENELLDDYNMWFKLLYLEKTFYNVKDILCKHRIHRRSAFNNINDSHVETLRNKWLDVFFPKEKLT